MFMGKKRKAVMLGVNVFLVLALLWSVVFTVDRKNAVSWYIKNLIHICNINSLFI